MLVSELIEWLKTQDQDAIVTCVYHTSGTGYYDQGGNVSEAEFTTEPCQYGYPEYYEYTDFRGNQFVKEGDRYYNKRYLLIGHKE